MRGPFGDVLVDALSGRRADAEARPLGVVRAAAFVVSVPIVVLALVGGLEAIVRPFVPGWLVVPLVVVAFGVVAVGGLVGVLRFTTRHRRRW